MRVVPSLGFRINGFLLKKLVPSLIPVIESRRKLGFSTRRERQSNRSKFLSCCKYGVHGQIPRHNPYLVELAHLYRKTRKGLSYAFSAVYDKGLNGESLLRKIIYSLLVC